MPTALWGRLSARASFPGILWTLLMQFSVVAAWPSEIEERVLVLKLRRNQPCPWACGRIGSPGAL